MAVLRGLGWLSVALLVGCFTEWDDDSDPPVEPLTEDGCDDLDGTLIGEGVQVQGVGDPGLVAEVGDFTVDFDSSQGTFDAVAEQGGDALVSDGEFSAADGQIVVTDPLIPGVTTDALECRRFGDEVVLQGRVLYDFGDGNGPVPADLFGILTR